MSRFTEFTRERRAPDNVSAATLSWYTHAFKWLPFETPTPKELNAVVILLPPNNHAM